MPPKQKQSKFQGADYSTYSIQKITPGSERTLGGGFSCARGEFVTYFKQGKIGHEIKASTSQCWVLHGTAGLAGYITLLADKLDLGLPGALKNEGVSYRTLPAVKIGWLAADERAKGAGKYLVTWALAYAAAKLAPMLGVRFMTLDAFYDKDVEPHYDISGFYLKLGFRYANPEETLPPVDGYRTMYYDLKPSLDLIKAAKEAQTEKVLANQSQTP